MSLTAAGEKKQKTLQFIQRAAVKEAECKLCERVGELIKRHASCIPCKARRQQLHTSCASNTNYLIQLNHFPNKGFGKGEWWWFANV